MRSVLLNTNANNVSIFILHNVAYVKQQCTIAFILTSIFHNVNAITASILAKMAECNATIRITFCISLLMICNNAQMPLSISYNVNAKVYCHRVLSAMQQHTIHLCIVAHHKQSCARCYRIVALHSALCGIYLQNSINIMQY